jgi:CRISPR/Cas system CMR-associated protein Cmr5 small subunit
MVWIQENYQTYAYRHIVGMLNQTLSSMLNNKKLRDAVAVIDQLYEIDEKEQGSNGSASFNKFSNMLSTRFMEDGKISNLIAGKFRK